MSKVNELRRKATEAVRGREYDRAIKLYGKICELDPSNGTPRNELGDLYLKTGNTVDAIDSFSLSARLYNDFGLTNNAVAVFKKILRHDPNHLDSLWGLAEIRREQGLDAEASAGYMEFLARAEQVPEAGREEFFKRAGELIAKMSDDLEILSRLEDLYRTDDRGDDVARVLIAKALQAHLEDEHEVRDRYIEHAREACEFFESLPAYHDYLDVVSPVDYSSGATSARGAGAADAVPESGPVEIDATDLDDLGLDEPDLAGPAISGPLEVGESGGKTVLLDTDALDLGFDFEDSGDDEAADADLLDANPSQPRSGSLNLLDEILADGSFDMAEDQQRQLDTIAREMQGQIAGEVAASDHAGQYELGIVYMDMGLFEQAIGAFEAAALGENYQLGALEMRGTCLLRLGRDGEALASFREGLGIKGAPRKAYLGLLYGVGSCLELRGETAEARTFFQRVAEVDPRFLDVAARLEQMRELS